MQMEQKVTNYDLPKELVEAKRWVCIKIETIGKEVVYIPWDPATGQTIEGSEPDNWMTFDDAVDLMENSPEYVRARLGFVLQREEKYTVIDIQNAISDDGEVSEVASQTLSMLEGCFYGEVEGSNLKLIVKGDSSGNKRFKNIGVTYSNRDYIVSLKGHGSWKPPSQWDKTQKLDRVIQYHYKMNCRVDENSKQLPNWYDKATNGLRFWANPLVTNLLKQKDWLTCKNSIFARNKGEGVYKRVAIDDIDNEIIDYLSPKYLKNNHIEETKQILLKRMTRDDGLFDFSRIKGKINFSDGFYDIESDTFGPYPENYRTAFQLNVGYKINAQYPRFLEYIETSLTEEDARTVQEMIGYILTTEMKAHKAFLLFGPGNTGKSILIDVIERIIGEDFVSNVPFQDLGTKFRTVQLFGKLLNTYGDLPQGSIKDTAAFKALVSGDSMHADDKFEKGFDFKNTARLLFATNKLPSNFVDQTSGFYRRLVLIPFQNIVSNENIDRDLKEVLFKEREGIVQWALIGLRRLIKNNYEFTESRGAKNLMMEYKRGNNSTLWFVDEFCEMDSASSESGKTLYDKYKKSCLDAKLVSVSQREFYAQIESQFANDGVAKHLGPQTRAVEFLGIKLIK